MDNLQMLIDGRAPLHKNAHVDAKGHFKDKGYKEVLPNQTEYAPRELLRSFYEEGNMFYLTNDTLKQQRTVYKVDNKFEVQFAATFFVVNLEQYLVSYLDVIKAKVPKQGLGSRFIVDLVEFLEMELEKDRQLKGAHLFVGQSQLLEPHVFFRKYQFGPLPQQFEHLKLEGSDLAYRLISQSREGEKDSASKRDKMAKEKENHMFGTSQFSQKTSTSRSGKALDKHCPLCSFKLIRGGDWARHCKLVHATDKIQGVRCISFECSKCTGAEQQLKSESSIKTNHQGHKMLSCGKCGVQREARKLKDSLCYGCSQGKVEKKTKTKTIDDVQASNFLNASALSRLPDQSQEIKPANSFSMVGDKQRRELMAQDLAYYHIGDTQSDPEFNENEESQREHPNKRASNGTALALVTQATTQVKHVLMASHLDVDAIKQLLDIEKSPLADDFLSLKLQNLAAMLPQEAVANLIQGSQYPRVASLFPLILSRASQLRNDQRAGVLFACVLFGGLHWPKAVVMLETLDDVTQSEVLQLFKVFIQRTHGEKIANWLSVNWKNVTPYHFELIKHLKSQPQPQVLEVLLFSLCVQVVEVSIFVEYAVYFAKTPASRVLIGYLENYKRQPVLTFNEFTALCSALMLEANIPVIKKCNEELMNSLLSDWISLLEKAAATVHLSDKSSIQEAIDEFIRAYGPIDEPFSKDLFTFGSSLGLLLHETPKRANCKQLGISQYSIGGSRRVQRQLWCVPSGDGKSMILNFNALLGLKTGMFQKVYLVYANKHLMTRDKVDFEDLWHLAELQDRVEHHIGCDFEAEENSLVLIDESDIFMFNKPKNFANFIKSKFCICLTATPSNCDQQGVENEVVKVLGFKQYDYIISQAPLDVAMRLQCDEVIQAYTLEEKVSAIESLLKQGSVLVYATEDLAERLKAFTEAEMVYENTDPLLLRQLDKDPYRLLIATDSFAMRGIDYRSKLNPMFLVIAQQFSCTREALQGVARVGRFGDPCQRVRFADCLQLVDQRKQREHNSQLLSFIEEYKGRVQVQAATANKFSPKKPQPTQGARMSQARARGLLARPSAGQLSLGKYFHPSAK